MESEFHSHVPENRKFTTPIPSLHPDRAKETSSSTEGDRRSGLRTKLEEFVTGQTPGHGVSSHKESSAGYSGEWPDADRVETSSSSPASSDPC
jgi:hypothetical protein